MEFEEVKALVAQHIELIKYSSAALREADDRCTKFLIVQAVLADYRLQMEHEKAKLETLVNAYYNKAFNSSDAKTVTDKKVMAESNPDYALALEAKEEATSTISWIKTYIDIFRDAHITYRNKAKE